MPIKNTKKIVFQLKGIILSFPIEKNKKTLAKLFASIITKKGISQKIALNLSQKTSCSFDKLHVSDCLLGGFTKSDLHPISSLVQRRPAQNQGFNQLQ